MKISTVTLLLTTVLGTVAFNPTTASAAGIDIHVTNQQNHPSVVDRDREISRQKNLELQRIAEQRAREQQRIAEQRAHEQQQRIAEQRAREQQQRIAEQRAREQHRVAQNHW